MALTFSRAAPLKPEIRLAQAVSQFEASLSDRQKIAFRNHRSQTIKSPPSTKDIMRITAEIDASQKTGGRCFGPRFTKFLHGAQQFAALGDIVVGSSQNVVACGVWSVLRMCLLATTNRASYIESLSLLLMEAGQSTQQHSDLALLYPRSKTLQTQITEYFIVVVQICLRFHLFAQKSALGKFASSLNDTDIKDARSSLLAWSKLIQAEIGTLVAQRVESEAESNSRFRAMMRLRSENASQQQKQIAFRDSLNSCSTYDYETTWRQIRKAGNTSLYKQMPEYNRWTVAPDSNTLVLVGKLGYGKSVTLANIVDDLNLRIEPGASGLAYFFCRHDLPESLIARTVMGALVRQIISPLPHRFNKLVAVEINGFHCLVDLTRCVVPPGYAMYIILDGLDLCSYQERKIITEQLELLRKQFNIRICVARRLEPQTELQSIATEFPEAEVVRLPDNSPDIEAFVAAQLETALSNQSLVLGDPTLILEIQDALLRGSRGMFLWVALQIQSLCTMQTDYKIREALANLPRDLSQIYSRILQQAKISGQSFQAEIFKLVVAARRPLTIHEMREALSVSPGNTTWDPSKLLNNIHPALTTCGCLITVDEEEQTIRTVHPSVNQFLLQDSSISPATLQEVQFTIEDAQTLISSIIVTYLSYGVFGTELAVRLPVLNVGSAPSHIINSTAGTSKTGQAMALSLLKSRKKPNLDASMALPREVKRQTPSNLHNFNFQHYAKTYIFEHLTELPVISCAIPDGLFRLYKRNVIYIKTKKEAIGLAWLVLQPPGNQNIKNLLSHVSFTITDHPWPPAMVFAELFEWAIETGCVHAIQYLLDIYRPIFLNYNVVCQGHDADSPGIYAFCQFQWYSGLPRYLPSRNEISSLFLGPSPLSYAIERSQHRVIDILVSDELIDINKGIALSLWDRPISIAMRQENTRALKLLLAAKVQERLELSLSEAKKLLNSAKGLDDGSIALLLEDYIRARFPAPV